MLLMPRLARGHFVSHAAAAAYLIRRTVNLTPECCHRASQCLITIEHLLTCWRAATPTADCSLEAGVSKHQPSVASLALWPCSCYSKGVREAATWRQR